MPRWIQKLRRRKSRLDAEELETVAEFARTAAEPSTVAQELGLALSIGRHAAGREVELIPLDDGMVKVAGHLPVEKGTAAYARIDTEARRRRRQEKSKTLEQHRAGTYADLLLKDGYGVTPGPRAEVYVYIDFATWLGLNDQSAELARQGMIPAWLARQIANGVCEPTACATGQIVSVGRKADHPPPSLPA